MKSEDMAYRVEFISVNYIRIYGYRARAIEFVEKMFIGYDTEGLFTWIEMGTLKNRILSELG